MKKFRNVNDGTILTEEELNIQRETNYSQLADNWKEEGFYNRDEYIAWLADNYIHTDYEEFEG
ncbi:hypothetical protein [Parasporobacterium paucivorans]|uniref:Uncharacterized protein n=1 Tax=Parasporobacterium paucivorans DSM 15970 TaxID=1122934 RepID=A0A1M6DRG2_9FIRM|nr:hypothetical protein [Parasporobacterium paucivorans]SHI75791.1 hypothetical protein SAMN02745691_00785 [Parasporobacterium paucivorans DSM 15970]